MVIDNDLNSEIKKYIKESLASPTYATNTQSTNASFDCTSLNNMIEELRPEYAILLNNYIESGKIFQIDNLNKDKYYCKKILLINHVYYKNNIEEALEQSDIDIKVYE